MAATVEGRNDEARDNPRHGEPGGVLLMTLGGFLIIAGAAMLLFLGLMVVDIVREPDDVKLVALVFDRIQGQDRAFLGVIGDNRFEFQLGEPLRTILFVLVVIWLLGAFARIINGIISAGRELMVAGRRR